MTNYDSLRKVIVGDFTEDDVITIQIIKNAITEHYLRKRKKNPNFFLSAEDLLFLQSDLEAHYNVSIPKEDAALFCKTTKAPTWWTDSKEEREPYYWDSYEQYLYNNEKLPEQVIARIDERADTVMNHLFNPLDNSLEDKKYGMVIGSVQSGKTANYTALISKAADAGFKIIVIIAGITSILRQQTQIRIDKSFIGQFDKNYEDRKAPAELTESGTVADYRTRNKVERERKRPFSMTESKIDSDFVTTSQKATQQTNLNNTTSPLVFVIKKNVTVLGQLLEWLKNKDKSTSALLMIDDEADNASINTLKDYQNVRTAINGGIRDILEAFPRSAYVGFTATPFANVFIDPLFETDEKKKDLFPKDFIVALESPDNYFGPQRIFGEDGSSKYIIPLSQPGTSDAGRDWEKFFPIKQKKGVTCSALNDLQSIPETLQKAIQLFAFNIAIRNKRGFVDKHNTMLIHVSRLVDMHEALTTQVENYVATLCQIVTNYYRMPASVEYRKYIVPLQEFFEEQQESGWGKESEFDVCSFSEILDSLPDIINSIIVGTANTNRNSISYSATQQTNLIAIGGNSLARGFTLINLSVSYFIRNTRMCDTLLQMGRWFGYRPGYEDLCRVFIPQEFAQNFAEAYQASEDLIDCVRKMEMTDTSPDKFLITISQHPATQMMLTAKNKMRNASLNQGVYLDGRITEKGTYNRESLHSSNYYHIVEDFIKGLGEPEHIPTENNRCYRWLTVKPEKIAGLIEKCPASFNVDIDSNLLYEYVLNNNNHSWRVVVPSLVKGCPLDFGFIHIKKIRRNDKNNGMNSHQYSFAVSDIGNEEMGLTEEEHELIKDNPNPKRRDLRAIRKNPLLIINIADLFSSKTGDAKLIEESFPFLSLSFAGSFSNPVFKPMMNFRFNEALNKKLQSEMNEEQESDDYDFLGGENA